MSDEENSLLGELGVILTRREALIQLDNIYTTKQDTINKIRIKKQENEKDYQVILEKLKNFYAK